MEAILDSIRLATTDGATDDERRRGAAACRALAEALDGVLVPVETAPEPAASVAPLALVPEPRALVAAPTLTSPLAANPFAGLTADQILDLAIAKLRSAVGDAQPPPAGAPFRLTLVPVSWR